MRTPRRSPLLLGAGLLGAAALATAAGRPAAARPPAAIPASAQPAQPAQPAARPALVVLITVDQLRGDYYDRFRGQLTGGLARLHRGAAFVNAHHDHAITETAPGHASTLSGRFPSSTGITRNAFGVADPQAPLIGAPTQPGASPFRFRGTTLVDWMRLHDPRTRALSVSRKDRGAILPLGRAKQPAFWWGNDGRFTTSTYYADTLPAWVTAFNARGAVERLAGTQWTLLLPDSAYAEPDSVPAESGGELFTFPHQIPADATAAAEALAGFPVMDSLTADLALAGLQAESLGTGPATDLLAVSFSSTDAVGHRFGPDSRELHDQILRLDRTLGRFLDSLFVLRDSTRVLIALTSDHGVAPLPGTRSHDPNEEAQRVDVFPLVAAMDSALQRRGLPPRAIAFAEGGIQVEREAFRRAGVPVDSVLDAFAAAARRIPGVQRVDRWDRLSQADTTRDVVARRWLHMFPPELAPDMVVTITPYSAMGRATYFQHGAPHDYDTHVPVVFYGPAFRPGRYDRYVRTVDIAPTLAAVLGVAPMERLDGVPLREAIR